VKSIKLNSFTKINLYLEIGETREDNYHNIRTIMTKTDFGDTIIVKYEENRVFRVNIKCNKIEIPLDSRNTVYKMLSYLNDIKPLNYEFDIHLKKNVPVQAGLGGASGDGAAIGQWILSKAEFGYNRDDMLKAAIKTGADVPFFFEKGIVEMGGIGEKVIERYCLFDMYFIVVKVRNINIATDWAYKNYKKHLTNYNDRINIMRNSLVNKDINGVAAALMNDFEPLVTEKYGELKSIKSELLKNGILGTSLTGSGSAIFGIVKNYNEAIEIKKRLMFQNTDVVVCRAVL